MERANITSQLKEILNEGTRGRIAPDGLNDETNLLTEVGLDSMEALDTLLLIEEKFGIQIADEDLNRDLFTTVSNLADYVNSRL